MSVQSNYMIEQTFIQWLDYLIRIKKLRKGYKLNTKI